MHNPRAGSADSAGSDDVERYLVEVDHPLVGVAGRLRDAILSTSPHIVESIKWKAPNFALDDDFATFNLRRAGAVQVILHTGAKRKPDAPEIVIDDPSSLLTWPDRNRAIATFTSEAAVAEALPAFTTIVRSWIAQQQSRHDLS